MKKLLLSVIFVLTIFLLPLGVTNSANAEVMIQKVHFLIPGGAGGGWDMTARTVGKVLNEVGLVDKVSFENMSGGGGGKAINYLITTARRQKNTLMVNSTPIVIRSLMKVFPQSFRDLTPVASVIADFGAFVVPNNSKYSSFKEIVDKFLKDPKSVKIAGGSVRGSMDHLVAAMAIQAAGGDPLKLIYVPYDAGGKAMAGLLSGDADVLCTGFGEAIGLAKQGEVKIIAVTSDKRLEQAPNVPTLKELGYDMVFANWRGFFGPPKLSADKVALYEKTLKKMYSYKEWETERKKRGWQNFYKPSKEFYKFLESQENEVGKIMKKLGFLK